MSEDDKSLLAMWDAKMSTASIAAMMGRREASVDKRLHQLLQDREAAKPIAFPVLPAPPPKPRPLPPPVILPTPRPAPAQGKSELPLVLRSLLAPPPPPPATVAGISPDVLGYCRRFRAAHWSLRETAALFDLDPEDLAEALACG